MGIQMIALTLLLLTVVTVLLLFFIQLFASRSLNEGAPDTAAWRISGKVERVCLTLVFGSLFLVWVWDPVGVVGTIAMLASVAVFVWRLVMRYRDMGIAKFSGMVMRGFWRGMVSAVPLVGAIAVAVGEGILEALSSPSEPKSTGDHIGPGGLDEYNHWTGRYDYEESSFRDKWTY